MIHALCCCIFNADIAGVIAPAQHFNILACHAACNPDGMLGLLAFPSVHAFSSA
jgi:hypothetical protein